MPGKREANLHDWNERDRAAKVNRPLQAEVKSLTRAPRRLHHHPDQRRM